jgi:hypothetical protein
MLRLIAEVAVFCVIRWMVTVLRMDLDFVWDRVPNDGGPATPVSCGYQIIQRFAA